MFRIFKLIKLFPGSPKKLGTKVYQWSKDDKRYSMKNSTDLYYPVENEPEHWEEVTSFSNIGKDESNRIIANCTNCGANGVILFNHECQEEDYEILSFKDLDDNSIIPRIGSHGCSEKTFLHPANTNIIIHSIKRLNDGEVFTVGDVVNFFWLRKDRKEEITTIRIHKGVLEIFGGGVINFIKDLKHVKTPLFTTEDGVDIFEGDKYFQIDRFFIEDYIEKYIATGINSRMDQQWEINSGVCLYFSTKTNAEEYIFKNKPVLTYNEVMYIFRNFQYGDFRSALINKVNKKLKTS